MEKIVKGVYPVMITPFTADNQVDWEAVDQIVEFYAKLGCDGIFAVCQSSEMFFLTEDEREQLAARVVKASAGRMCVVASGHISDAIEDQIRELRRVAATGVNAVVMISNRLAAKDESDDVLIANMHRILDAVPDVPFGMYECPCPYKRLLTPKVLEAMAETGRFRFIKDTCCDAKLIAERVRLLNGRIQLFNANCATFLETLKDGADGFSGIMANYHPELSEAAREGAGAVVHAVCHVAGGGLRPSGGGQVSYEPDRHPHGAEVPLHRRGNAFRPARPACHR